MLNLTNRAKKLVEQNQLIYQKIDNKVIYRLSLPQTLIDRHQRTEDWTRRRDMPPSSPTLIERQSAFNRYTRLTGHKKDDQDKFLIPSWIKRYC